MKGTAADAAHVLHLDLASAIASEELRAGGVPSILLKGPGLARWIYEDDAFRSYGDIDLIVAPDQTDTALEILEQLGYRDLLASETERDATPHARVLQAPTGLATGKASERGATDGMVTIDLHRSFHGIGAPDERLWSELSARVEGLRLFGVTVNVPGEAAQAMMVALHVTVHGRDRRLPFSDLDRALAKGSDDLWADAAALARRLDAFGPFVAGLRMTPAGVELTRRLRFEAQVDPATRVRAEVPMAKGLERLAQTAGVWSRLRLISRELAPTPAYLRVWSPLARRGYTGPALAYAYRPFWLLVRLPVAAIALWRARRGGS